MGRQSVSDPVYSGEVLIVGVPDDDVARLSNATQARIADFEADVGPDQILQTSLTGGRLVMMKVSEEP